MSVLFTHCIPSIAPKEQAGNSMHVCAANEGIGTQLRDETQVLFPTGGVLTW